MNVVEQWRTRARQLRAEYWSCTGCDAMSVVRRERCSVCECDMHLQIAQLPRQMKVVAYSHDYSTLERSDHSAQPAVSVLVEFANGRMFPMLLCEGDSELAPQLVGHVVSPALRRLFQPGPTDPITYGIKAVADLDARETLFRNQKPVER